MERQGTNQTRITIERRMCHWLAALQDSGYEACQAREYALDGVGCRPVEDPTHHPTTHPAGFFASPWQLLPALDNHPGSSLANPKPCRCSTEEQPRKNLLTGRNAPSEELPFWSNSSSQWQLDYVVWRRHSLQCH